MPYRKNDSVNGLLNMQVGQFFRPLYLRVERTERAIALGRIKAPQSTKPPCLDNMGALIGRSQISFWILILELWLAVWPFPNLNLKKVSVMKHREKGKAFAPEPPKKSFKSSFWLDASRQILPILVLLAVIGPSEKWVPLIQAMLPLLSR